MLEMKISRLKRLVGMNKTTQLINYLIQNKRRIAKCLYLAAALIENIPDGHVLKKAKVRIISSSKARHGKRLANK